MTLLSTTPKSKRLLFFAMLQKSSNFAPQNLSNGHVVELVDTLL